MRTYLLTLVAILFIGPTTVCSQNFESGLPYSKTSFCPEPIANATVPSKTHTGLSTQTLLQESLNNPNLKNRFSVGYAESINLIDDGLWNELPNGDRIWRQQITATDALGLTVYFNHFQLDAGSELFVYDNITGEILWSYGHTDNRPSFKKSIRFPMETMILELYEPSGNESHLEIERIGYQYEDVCRNNSDEACYQDILCSDYSAFSEVSNAVVRILVTIGDDEYGGTAAFINNSCNDGRPLLLTNHHNVKNSVDPEDCDIDVNDQAQLDYAAIVLNCVRPSANCNDNEVAVSNYQMLEGLAFVAQCAQTDMALVEYDGTIPEGTNFYLAGWDASGTISDAASVIIHHTLGFPKKISVANSEMPRISLSFDWNCIPTGTDYYEPVFGAGHNIWGQGLSFSTMNAPDAMVIEQGTGKVQIGPEKVSSGPHANYRLSVDGKIVAKEIVVTTDESYWSDYVFEKGYELRPISEVEAFIAEHGHLPDVPSAKEVTENGQDLGRMDAILLRKIEELTLYIIEVEKRLNEKNGEK